MTGASVVGAGVVGCDTNDRRANMRVLAMQCFTEPMCTKNMHVLLTSGVGTGVGGVVVGLTEGLWVGESVSGGSVLISTKTVGVLVSVLKRGGVPVCEPPYVGE